MPIGKQIHDKENGFSHDKAPAIYANIYKEEDPRFQGYVEDSLFRGKNPCLL